MEDLVKLVVVIIAIFIATFIIAVRAYCAYLMQQSMVLKGYGKDLHAWAICFWCGVFGYFYILSLPDKIQQSQNQQMIELLKEREKIK